MNEQVWTTFKMVAEVGSISQAARALNLSQSAVSQQIQMLEQSYATHLFVRTSQGVHLTEMGEVLYRYVTALLRLIHESQDAVQELTDNRPQVLAIGASLTIAEYLLPGILAEYCRDMLNARWSVTMANSRTVFEQVLNHTLDIGLIEAPMVDAQVVVRPFFDDQPVVMVARTHPWAERQEVTLEEFMEEPLILREPGSGTRMALENALGYEGIDLKQLNIRLVLGTTHAIKQMMLKGLGVSVLSPLTIEPRERDLFASVQVAGLSLYRTFSLVYHRDAMTRIGERFVQTVMRVPASMA
ncbi:MAG: LysR family transcriptional regulator [Sulfobacillus thermosulfidooxidans]|uniref:LysR family transcriptional regulator n=1 Tax=Sulfobacillus thermotolerans TaxID=338644 RepID=A0ABM6RV87_9FIRM|nr:LysR family transcriptional regulator [Sulfobacillus thermotolerans]PSR37918.1 MAG: LysR family transcriptional regulator [Sulfobacillus thermosulfidooxidans]